MTDARHHSTANAYHSTVVCLLGRLVQDLQKLFRIRVLFFCFNFQFEEGQWGAHKVKERTFNSSDSGTCLH